MPPAPVGRLKRLQAEAQEAFDDSALAGRQESEQTRFQRFVHFWVLVARSFVRNRCPIRASSLAYASLLAVVPMLAVVIGISSSLLRQQGEEPIDRFVTRLVESVTPSTDPPPFTSPVEESVGPGEESKAQLTADTRQEIKARIMEFVGNIRSGALSVTGVVALLAVAISMLARIEDTFNDIWGVTRGRSWPMRIIQYWAAISLGPVLMITAVALTSGPYLGVVRDFVSRFGTVGEVAVKTAMALLPYLILSLAFGLLYALMPNTKVRWRAAAVGGVVAGVLWQLNQEFSVFYVSRVVSNSRIYGSLGAVPVFMIGLYISWVILLFGAQVAYAFQNRRAYLQERQVELVNQRSREFIALRLVTQIGQSFEQGGPPPTLTRLAEHLGVPSRLANQLLGQLEKAGCVAEVSGAEGGFVPGRPLDRTTAADVLKALRVDNGRDLATRGDSGREAVLHEFERIGTAEREVAASVTLQELVRRAGKSDA